MDIVMARSIWETDDFVSQTFWPAGAAKSSKHCKFLDLAQWWKSARVCRCDSQYQEVYGPALGGRFLSLTKNEFHFAGLVWTCWQYRSAWWRWENSGIATFSSMTCVVLLACVKVREQGLVGYRNQKGIRIQDWNRAVNHFLLAYLRSRSHNLCLYFSWKLSSFSFSLFC